MSFYDKSIPDFNDDSDDSVFRIFSDLMTRFMVLSHSSASVEGIFLRVDNVETKTISLKQDLLRKVAGKTSIVKKPAKRLYMDT